MLFTFEAQTSGEKLLITFRWIIFGCVFLLIWVIFGEKFAKYYCNFFPFTIVIDSHQIDRVITITTENSMKLISLFLHKFDILFCSKKYLKAYVANAFERILNWFSVDVGIFWESPRAQSIVLYTVSINQFSRKRHYLETCRVCKLNDFHDCPIFRILFPFSEKCFVLLLYRQWLNHMKVYTSNQHTHTKYIKMVFLALIERNALRNTRIWCDSKPLSK